MKCRHCNAALSLPLADLGSAPPSNAYLSSEGLTDPEVWYPLRVMVCATCWLVQTEDHAGREELFAHDYAYFSSTSSSWLAHAKTYVSEMVARFSLNEESVVVEIAANDGYLLQYVKERGIPCYGVEPTASTAAAARALGIDIAEVFFGEEQAGFLAVKKGKADLIAANNVLAHVPNINDFVKGFAALLKPTGVATFEFPHLMKLMSECQFDTIYHEHYSYLSLIAVERIFRENGLAVFDVEELSTHGGSLRVFAQKAGGSHPLSPRVAEMLSRERSTGMDKEEFYAGFQSRVEKVKDDVVAFLIAAKAQGKKVGAYGAAAKGNTLLNFAGVRPDLLPYVVDRAASKQGKFMPGSRIPIVDEAHLKADKPDIIWILPWNIADEVRTQLDYAKVWGASFVTAVPELNIAPA